MGALLLERNGRVLSSKHTKHIKAKYFLIKDYYDAAEIDVRFCPTDRMWVDVLIKSLQGQKYRDMHAFLQNCPQDYDNDNKIKQSMNPQDVASSQECVIEHAKSLPKSRPVSPTCVSQIPGGNPRVTWGRNKIKTLPVNNIFPVGQCRSQDMGKSKKLDATSQPHIFPVISKGQTKAESNESSSRLIAIT
jgi:hypothetical protein